MKVRNQTVAEVIELDMTAMIDIVFLLLIFFIMTFTIMSVEGDFNIQMPLAAPGGAVEDVHPPIRIRLTAAPDGSLSGIQMGARGLASFQDLHNEVRAMINDDTGPGSLAESIEVELDCDYGLHYMHVMDAITSVSGHVDAENNVIKLIERVKFAPPRPRG